MDRCRWAENSYCLSEDILKTQRGHLVSSSSFNSKCRSGSTCTSKNDGKTECSFQTVFTYFMSQYGLFGFRGQRPSLQSMLRDMYLGKICTCKVDHSLNEIDDEDDDWWKDSDEDSRRKKRSAYQEEEQENYAAWIAPVFGHFH